MLMSGSLPMSSAETDSTMPSAFFFTLIEFSMPRRMPVTVIDWAEAAAAGWVEVCACAAPIVSSNTAAPAATGLSAKRGVGATRPGLKDCFTGDSCGWVVTWEAWRERLCNHLRYLTLYQN